MTMRDEAGPSGLRARNVRAVGTDVAIWRIDTQGHPSPFARMVPVAGGGFWVEESDGVREHHDGLPWFLCDMRPQGFMGRHFAHRHPDLHLPTDPRHWSDDDVLRALALRGEDLPGNLIVGADSLMRLADLGTRLVWADCADAYPELAHSALLGQWPGSSAGGEQPKFCCITQGRSVIVKFSSSDTHPAAQRTRDLLYCEHIALNTLAQAGLPAAPTQVFEKAGRVFLESQRFDRCSMAAPTSTQHHAIPGRIGMVSLLVYDAQYVGHSDNWAATALRMRAHHPPLLSEHDAHTLRLLEAYGCLIGNTDRHYGNISLVLHDDDWCLSPTYDMLPMFYMPIAGELVVRDLALNRMRPTAATHEVWDAARDLARQFWGTVAHDQRICPAFRQHAHRHVSELA